MILIVDMNYEKESLAYNEFVAPIVSVIEPLEVCEVRHFLELEPQKLDQYSKIVLSGTTLKDFVVLKHVQKFGWLKTYSNPILGICSGLQIISVVFGEPLKDCLQIGITEIKTVNANPLFEGTFKAYALHSLSVTPSQTFSVLAESSDCIMAVKHQVKDIYGVLFHPEARNPDILKRFVELK